MSPAAPIPEMPASPVPNPGAAACPAAPSYRLIRQLFVRGIGAVYLIAILSLWTQIQGLVGSHGLLPIRHYLELVHQFLPHDWFWSNPSLVWLNASDGFLSFLCGAGLLLSLLVIVGIAQCPALALLWVIYLSLTVAGQEFMNFQWDALLLEAGLLAVFFAPSRLLSRPTLSLSKGSSRESGPSRIVLWLIRWLLFRLMFLSGLVKLLSGDSSWRDGTALNYHYLTQPLPSWTAYWAYQLPAWFQWLSVWAMFGIELVTPFFIFLGDVLDACLALLHQFFGLSCRPRFGRRSRQAAFVFLMLLQLLITATGNFGFFNLLAMLLCVPLLDDEAFPRRLRSRLRLEQPSAAKNEFQGRSTPGRPGPGFRRARLLRDMLLAPLIVFLTTLTALLEVLSPGSLPKPLLTVVGWVAPFRSTNGYGLFRVMTQERFEIIIEGSDDGIRWKPYEFTYKPGDLYRRPGFCTPLMPRLDWQMWFYAIRPSYENRWFIPLLMRLLAGDQHVLALLGENPFPYHPPKYVQVLKYNYTFAPVNAEGRWWGRSHGQPWVPPVTLEQMRRALPDLD